MKGVSRPSEWRINPTIGPYQHSGLIGAAVLGYRYPISCYSEPGIWSQELTAGSELPFLVQMSSSVFLNSYNLSSRWVGFMSLVSARRQTMLGQCTGETACLASRDGVGAKEAVAAAGYTGERCGGPAWRS